jgi:DNA-directed RNA polymerase I, II, and III subunit RPABC1
MGKRKDLSPRKKGQLSVLLEETNLNQMKIAKKIGLSPQAVSMYAKRLKEGIATFPRRISACERKKLTSERSDRKLVQSCIKDRKATSEKLHRQWRESDVAASSHTVRRRLWDSGLKSRNWGRNLRSQLRWWSVGCTGPESIDRGF